MYAGQYKDGKLVKPFRNPERGPARGPSKKRGVDKKGRKRWSVPWATSLALCGRARRRTLQKRAARAAR